MYRLPGLSLPAAAVVMDQAARMTLVRLRHNNTYQDLGEDFGVTHQTA